MSTLTTRRNIVFSVALVVLLAAVVYGFVQRPGMIPRHSDEMADKDLVKTVDVDMSDEIRNTFDQRILVTKAAIEARESVGQDVALLQFALASDADIIGDLVTAREYYEDYMQSNPVNFTVMLNYAAILTRMGDLDRAEEMYRHVIEIVPTEEHLNRYVRFLETYNENGSRDAELKDLYELSLDFIGQREWILLGLGDWYLRNNDCKAAIDHYEVALQINPSNENTQNDIAELRATCR